MAQTDIQKSTSIRKGSMKLEIGNTLGSLVDIGAIRDFSWNAQGETSSIEFDNVDPITKFTKGDIFSADFTLCEIDWSNIELMNGGQVSVSTVAGALVSGALFAISETEWEFDKVVQIEGQNDDNTAPTINSVTGSVDGVTSDYKIVKLPNGKWGISIDTGGALTTEAQDVTVDYDYTPTASKQVSFEATGQLQEKFLRITNVDEFGNDFVITMSGVTNTTTLALNFASDNSADEVATLPVTLSGKVLPNGLVDTQVTT